jgi:hypothetical protein
MHVTEPGLELVQGVIGRPIRSSARRKAPSEDIHPIPVLEEDGGAVVLRDELELIQDEVEQGLELDCGCDVM